MGSASYLPHHLDTCRMNREQIKAKTEEIVKQKKMRYLDKGGTRRTYLTKSGRFVVKFPIRKADEHCNIQEAEDFETLFLDGNIAKCRLITLGGLKCLMMERVRVLYSPQHDDNEIHSDDENLPKWTNRLVDGPQIGINRKGKMVAYDWSSHYSED